MERTTVTFESFATEVDVALERGEIAEPDANAFLESLFAVASQTGLDGTAELPDDIATALREKLFSLCHQNA